MKDIYDRLRCSDHLDQEEVEILAQSKDPEVRRLLAQRIDLTAELLDYLAGDEDPHVRRAIAENQAAAFRDDLQFAVDPDEDLLERVVGRMAPLAPDLRPEELDALGRQICEALESLSTAKLAVVRHLVIEGLRHHGAIAPQMVRKLALDVESLISQPLSYYFLVLTDDDLREVIDKAPFATRLRAISRRHQGLDGAASHDFRGSDDDNTISLLLSNTNTQIREETLDALMDGAPIDTPHPAAQPAALKVSPGAEARLAKVIVDRLLTVLASRTDLSQEEILAIKQEADRRLNIEPFDASAEPLMDHYQRALEALRRGVLSPDSFSRTLSGADCHQKSAELAALADVPWTVASAILRSHDAKAVIALCWAANLTPQVAVQVQRKLARIPFHSSIDPTAEGGWPMPDGEMNWHLDMFMD